MRQPRKSRRNQIELNPHRVYDSENLHYVPVLFDFPACLRACLGRQSDPNVRRINAKAFVQALKKCIANSGVKDALKMIEFLFVDDSKQAVPTQETQFQKLLFQKKFRAQILPRLDSPEACQAAKKSFIKIMKSCKSKHYMDVEKVMNNNFNGRIYAQEMYNFVTKYG